MKFNWGYGIAIFYTLFALTLVGLVLYSRTLDNSLVVDNYYDKDIQYQSHVEKLKNSQALPVDLALNHEEKTQILRLQFPEDIRQIEGTVLFYRADDKKKDFEVKISLKPGNVMALNLRELYPGKWTVKVDWQGDGKPFYKEQAFLF